MFQGCTVLEYSVFSAPQITNSEEGEVSDNSIQVKLSGSVNVIVTALDRPVLRGLVGPYILPPVIPVYWKFYPKTFPEQTLIEVRVSPGIKPVLFNPMKIRMETDDGKELHPKGFNGPNGITSSRNLAPPYRIEYPCMSTKDSFKTTVDAILLDQPSCFFLLFDTSPDPRRKFTLLLKAIEQRDGIPIDIPPIYFMEAATWAFYTIP